MIDAARWIEAHEAVPLDRLRPWLEGVLGGPVGALRLGRFGRGYSNLTFLLEVDGRELVLRRGPPGVDIATAHDMVREARVVQQVGRGWAKVPRIVGICEDASVLGGTFYVMERLRGVILRDRVPEGLDLGPDVMARLSGNLIDTLAEIHALDLDAVGLRDLGRPEGYVARQVAGWTKRYQGARTDDVADMDWLAGWLEANRPAESGAVLVHNDFKYDNVVLDPEDPSRILAVLDWEMATVGDPLLDLGTALAYWVQSDDPPAMQVFRLCLTDLPGNLGRTALVARYQARTGRTFDPVWYLVFGLFKNAVVAQQLYARFQRGLTTEARYAGLIWAVRGIAGIARAAAEQHRIEGIVAPELSAD